MASPFFGGLRQGFTFVSLPCQRTRRFTKLVNLNCYDSGLLSTCSWGAGWKANGAQAELAFQPARGDLTAPGLAATGG